MRTLRTTALSLAVCFVLVLAYNWGFLAFGDPAGAARVKARELGFERNDLVVVAGGYSSTFLSWTSTLQFRSRSKPELGEILVEVSKPTPLHGWRLDRFVHAGS